MAIERITQESRLCELVLQNFSDWEIYPEVTINTRGNKKSVGPGGSGSIDIVLKRSNHFIKAGVIMTIEAKLKMNFDVLDQAYRNTGLSHYSYICLPNPKKFPPIFIRICKNLGIGILTVNETDHVIREVLKPRLNRNIRELVLEDWMKSSVAGSLHGRMTAYKFAIEHIILNLKRNGGKMNIHNVFEKGHYHWGSLTSAKKCIINYARKKIITEFRVEGNYFILNEDL